MRPSTLKLTAKLNIVHGYSNQAEISRPLEMIASSMYIERTVKRDLILEYTN